MQGKSMASRGMYFLLTAMLHTQLQKLNVVAYKPGGWVPTVAPKLISDLHGCSQCPIIGASKGGPHMPCAASKSAAEAGAPKQQGC